MQEGVIAMKHSSPRLRAERIAAALAQGDKVQISGFGSFEVKEREARVGRNPQTGEAMEIAASRIPAFKAGKALKDRVAK